MSIPQKLIPPDIARDELTPKGLELLGCSNSLEQLTDMVNRQQERLQALEQEIALGNAGKRAQAHAVVRKKLAAPYIAEAERPPAVMKLLAWGDGLTEIIVIQPAGLIQPGSRFKGYRDFVVQDPVIGSRNTRCRPLANTSRSELDRAASPGRRRQPLWRDADQRTSTTTAM